MPVRHDKEYSSAQSKQCYILITVYRTAAGRSHCQRNVGNIESGTYLWIIAMLKVVMGSRGFPDSSRVQGCTISMACKNSDASAEHPCIIGAFTPIASFAKAAVLRMMTDVAKITGEVQQAPGGRPTTRAR